jgi:uncharacterized protein
MVKEIAYRAFVSSNGLDVNQLPCEGDHVHGREDTLGLGEAEIRALNGKDLWNEPSVLFDRGPALEAGECLMRYSWLTADDPSMTTTSRSIRSLSLAGPAGRIEALLNEGSTDASHAALVCHPHPVYGGTLHNKVVFHAMKALNTFGFPVLRFNFRGAGLSEGQHDHGAGEVADVQAALDWLLNEFHLPVVLAGFSFGAAVGLRVACASERVKAAIGLGLPVAPIDDRTYDFSFLQNCAKPKLFVSGARDQFGPPAKLRPLIEALPDPKKLVFLEGADHFFEGRLRELREIIEAWVREVIA